MSRRFGKAEGEAPPAKFNKETFRKAIGIFTFVSPYKWYLIAGLALLFFGSLVFMIFPYLIGQMVDIADGKSDKAMFTLTQIGWFLIVILILQGFISYYRVMFFANASERGIADVRKAVYQKMLTLPITFYEKNRVGELISRVTADVEQLASAFSIVLAELVRQVIIMITGVVLIFIISWKLALIMLLTFPVIVIGAIFIGRIIRRLSKERQQGLADTNIILSETLQSINVVKSFTNEWFEARRYGNSIDGLVKVAMKFARGRALFSAFIVSVLFGALFFVIWQAVQLMISGDMSSGDLIAFVSYTAFLGAAIGSLGSFYTQLLGAIGATERIREILDAEGEVKVENPSGKIKSPITGDIEYKNVHFAYPTREDIQVLKGIDFTIKAGEKVALVGTSGAGKSTIVQLLLRFYNLTNGEILIDGKNGNDYELSAFRHQIAIVPQEVMLFGGTIYENILYGKPEATREEVLLAARQSNSFEFIDQFPEKFETVVGERGVKLSGGQRQRVAIARAILRNPAILILDEATSSLDAESEKVVQDALNVLMEGRTSIIIAHRLATIREVDCIYVMDNGKIIEEGTHEELSAVEDGAYSHLAKLQFEANREV